MKNKVIIILAAICVYLAVPVIVTMLATGVIEEDVSDELINGRRITVEYRNATRSTEIDQFIVMVLAGRLEMSAETEVLKAESVMIRTDIYRRMGDQMHITSKELAMPYYTKKQMESMWGDKYEENYNLLADCVAATSGIVMRYNGELIEALYMPVSCGSTLSGSQLLGDAYAYLSAVDCPDDLNCPGYLSVISISNKDFVKKAKAQYADIGLQEGNPASDIQIVQKTENGYVLKIQVGNVVMTGSKFAEIFGIPGSCMQLEQSDGSIKITAKGAGDGFGVSIYTAGIMAQNGSSYEEILQKFYSGISFVSE